MSREKVLKITTKYVARPEKYCTGCAFDETGRCPAASCVGIKWVEISAPKEKVKIKDVVDQWEDNDE